MQRILRWDFNSHLRGLLPRPGLHHTVKGKGVIVSHAASISHAEHRLKTTKKTNT